MNGSRSCPQSSGFTLTEVLVAAALGLIGVAAVGSVLVQHVRTMTLQTVQLRFQDDWARASHFIETEVSEGERITTATDGNCGAAAGDLRFTIEVPVIVGTTETLTSRTISYYQVPNAPAANALSAIVRCGPPINADGTLDVTGGQVTSVLLSNARLNVNNAFTTANPAQFVEYNIEFLDVSPAAFSAPFLRTYPATGQFVQARTKPNYIDD
jgi:prepilin-type N-terminal cleavage/methylation domain-containing protein